MDTARRERYLDALGITVWKSNTAGEQELPHATDSMPEQADPLDEALERAIKAPAPELPEIPPTPEAAPAPTQPADTTSIATLDWNELEAAVKDCKQCALCEDRQQAVFGVGVQSADLMVIGEGPGAEEDRQGLPFVGPAGQLLDKMLAAIGYSRAPRGNEKAAYIANVVKCRPPQNRDPKPEESAACRAYLNRQIALLKPRLIMAVGRVAAQNLLDSSDKLGALRSGLHEYQIGEGGAKIPVLVTYHPAYLLRSPSEKRKAWEDLKRARGLLSDSV